MSYHPLLRMLLLSATIGLWGCGEPTAEGLRKEYAAMGDEALMAKTTQLRGDCRQAKDDSDKPGAPCNRLLQAEMAAQSKGWCWGPDAAASWHKAWMRCSDDVTESEQANATWYAATKSGSCREATLSEAIGKVLDHDGPRNIKTSFTKSGFFDVSSRLKDGSSYSVRLYPSCGAALMVYITPPGGTDGTYVAAPLGMSPREAGEHFGFDVGNCGMHTFGNSMGCGKGYVNSMAAPIQMSDGYVPCGVGKSVQFDFHPRQGMTGVTCGATAETKAGFEQRMTSAFGEPQRPMEGVQQWKRGPFLTRTTERVVYTQTMRFVSVIWTDAGS